MQVLQLSHQLRPGVLSVVGVHKQLWAGGGGRIKKNVAYIVVMSNIRSIPKFFSAYFY